MGDKRRRETSPLAAAWGLVPSAKRVRTSSSTMITPLRMQSRDVGQSAYTTSDRSKGRHLKQSRGKLFPKKEPSEAAPKTIPSESRRSRSHRTSHDTRVKEEHIRQGVIELSDDELFEEIQGDEQDTNNDSAIVLYNKRQDNALVPHSQTKYALREAASRHPDPWQRLAPDWRSWTLNNLPQRIRLFNAHVKRFEMESKAAEAEARRYLQPKKEVVVPPRYFDDLEYME